MAGLMETPDALASSKLAEPRQGRTTDKLVWECDTPLTGYRQYSNMQNLEHDSPNFAPYFSQTSLMRAGTGQPLHDSARSTNPFLTQACNNDSPTYASGLAAAGPLQPQPNEPAYLASPRLRSAQQPLEMKAVRRAAVVESPLAQPALTGHALWDSPLRTVPPVLLDPSLPPAMHVARGDAEAMPPRNVSLVRADAANWEAVLSAPPTAWHRPGTNVTTTQADSGRNGLTAAPPSVGRAPPPVPLDDGGAAATVSIALFNGELHESFPRWLEDYETVAHAYGWSRELQLQRLGLYLRGRARDIYRLIAGQARSDYTAVREDLLVAFTSGAWNEAARLRLHSLRQEENQNVYDFYRTLKDVAAVAYPTLDAIERDRLTLSLFVNGLQITISKVIFYRGCTTLEEALVVAEECEANPRLSGYSGWQLPLAADRTIHSQDDDLGCDYRYSIESKVDALTDQVIRLCDMLIQGSGEAFVAENREGWSPERFSEKPSSGYRSSVVEDDCPVFRACSIPNHVAANCPESEGLQARRHVTFEQADRSHNDTAVGYVGRAESQSHGAWAKNTATPAQSLWDPAESYGQTYQVGDHSNTDSNAHWSTAPERPHVYSLGTTAGYSCQHSSTVVPVQVNGTPVDSLWDTGASISLISATLASQLRTPLEYAQVGAVTITGAHLPVIGAVTALLHVGNYCRAQHLYVVTDTARQLVLGTDFLATLPPVTFDYQQGSVSVGGHVLTSHGASQPLRAAFVAATTLSAADVQSATVLQKRRRPRRRRQRYRLPRDCSSGAHTSISVVGKPEPVQHTRYYVRLPAVKVELISMNSAAAVMRKDGGLTTELGERQETNQPEASRPNDDTYPTHHESMLDRPERITPRALDCLHTNRVVMPRPRLKHRIANVVSDDAAWQNRPLAVQDVLLGEACTESPSAPNCLHDNWDSRPRPRPRTSIANVEQSSVQT